MATATRVGGLGGEMLESAAGCCAGAVPGPATAVPEPGVAVPEPVAEVPGPAAGVSGSPAWFFEPDPAVSGSGGTKMESDSGDGLMDGLRRRCRAMPVGIACRVEPIRARASAGSL